MMILQARTLEWVAISSSNAWKWKVKVKLLSRVQLLATPWTAAYQAPPPMGFSKQEYWSGLPLPSCKIMSYPVIHHLDSTLWTHGQCYFICNPIPLFLLHIKVTLCYIYIIYCMVYIIYYVIYNNIYILLYIFHCKFRRFIL